MRRGLVNIVSCAIDCSAVLILSILVGLILTLGTGISRAQEAEAADQLRFRNDLIGAWVISDAGEGSMKLPESIGQLVLIVDDCIFLFQEESISFFKLWPKSEGSASADAYTVRLGKEYLEFSGTLKLRVEALESDCPQDVTDVTGNHLRVCWKGDVSYRSEGKKVSDSLDGWMNIRLLDSESGRKRIKRRMEIIIEDSGRIKLPMGMRGKIDRWIENNG